jgi:hypothetical protein
MEDRRISRGRKRSTTRRKDTEEKKNNRVYHVCDFPEVQYSEGE